MIKRNNKDIRDHECDYEQSSSYEQPSDVPVKLGGILEKIIFDFYDEIDISTREKSIGILATLTSLLTLYINQIPDRTYRNIIGKGITDIIGKNIEEMVTLQ